MILDQIVSRLISLVSSRSLSLGSLLPNASAAKLLGGGVVGAILNEEITREREEEEEEEEVANVAFSPPVVVSATSFAVVRALAEASMIAESDNAALPPWPESASNAESLAQLPHKY